MGQLLLTGTGVDKDYEKAAFWFTKSAEGGDAVAQGKIGYLYRAGLGVPQDNVKAYAWLKLAAVHKNEQAAKDLLRLKTILTAEDLQAGETLFNGMRQLKK